MATEQKRKKGDWKEEVDEEKMKRETDNMEEKERISGEEKNTKLKKAKWFSGTKRRG